jgi:hypothetical protein
MPRIYVENARPVERFRSRPEQDDDAETLELPTMNFDDDEDDGPANQDRNEILGTPKWNWKE